MADNNTNAGAARRCPHCGGEPTRIEIEPLQEWEGFTVAGVLEEVCSGCGRYLGQVCDDCGGKIVWVWCGPGQALWKCQGCDYEDLALHVPPRPHRWKCARCKKGYYSFKPPAENQRCNECLSR